MGSCQAAAAAPQHTGSPAQPFKAVGAGQVQTTRNSGYFYHQDFKNPQCIFSSLLVSQPYLAQSSLTSPFLGAALLRESRIMMAELETLRDWLCLLLSQSDKKVPQLLPLEADPGISLAWQLFLAHPFPEPPNSPPFLFCISFSIPCNGSWDSLCKACGRTFKIIPLSPLPALKVWEVKCFQL